MFYNYSLQSPLLSINTYSQIYLHRLSLILLVVLHLHIIRAQHLILLKSPIPQKFIHIPILTRRIGVLHERPRQGLDTLSKIKVKIEEPEERCMYADADIGY